MSSENQHQPGQTSAVPDTRDEFSLVVGGPFYQFLLRARLVRSPMEFVWGRTIVVMLIVWLPLLLLSMIDGRLAGGGVPFLHDIEANVRFLIALPILIFAELVIHQRLGSVISQFIDRGIVVPDELPIFRAAIGSAIRLRNSAMEIVLLVIVYTVGHWIWRQHIALDQTTWFASRDDSGRRLTYAGVWYAFVSIPLFQFILLRWYFRLFVWFQLLWRISRLNLRLIATHPDQAAGLGFVGNSAYAFAPILLA